MATPLPAFDEMYRAVAARDTTYDGIFFTAVRTTGIFCRPGCPARLPRREHVEFHATAREALAAGFRPCLRCRPLEGRSETPPHIAELITALDSDPSLRLTDRALRERSIDPAAVRRWFKRHHGMSFQAYQRALRVGHAVRALGNGAPVSAAAFDAGYESLSAFTDAIRRIIGDTPVRARGAAVVYVSRVATPLGPMLLGATAAGVCLLEFTDRRMLETQLRRIARRLGARMLPGHTEPSRQIVAELEEYFAGRLHEFRTPLVLAGTPFQEQAWTALRAIPHGHTRSYAEQAREIGRPAAMRAVARANGDNRISIVIPCHRVVGSDGELTGYGGGLWRKRWLLDHERAASAMSDASFEQECLGGAEK